ncbi:HAD-IA family hydrolase [Silvimonas amylolytica]|uniref:Hydrolase n=1 Tax=Silvimonas amylolytica TaxID=449663 RepID=A0ABQ2PRI2_9NEIS|nr:HAD-IA family hydrolase [Silvimonas amylolytica]GGP28219.1 hydrolase [Silvimonas amylolytica]
MSVRAVVFDFGGVLFDWNPEYLYRKLIPDATERQWFLQHVCNGHWNLQQDAGRTLADATEALIAQYPDHAELIRAFYGRWPETLAGTLPEGIKLMEDLETARMPLYGLTNWSDETFPYAWEHYPFLHRFKDIVVSGRLKIVKPDAAIYHEMFRRIAKDLPDLKPAELVFIDDNAANAEAARALGWHGIHHVNAAQTEAALRDLGLSF